MSGEAGTITNARKNTRPAASPTEALAHRIKMIITMNTCQERSGKVTPRRIDTQTLDAAAMRSLDWCDDDLEKTAGCNFSSVADANWRRALEVR
jgi:hypothetical protein